MGHFKNFLLGLNIFLLGVITFAKIYDCFLSNPIPIETIKTSDWCIIIGGPIIIILFIIQWIIEKRKVNKSKKIIRHETE